MEIEHPRAANTTSGYSLLETVVALAIFGMAILVASSALQSHAMLLHRSEVRAQLLRSAEDVLEQVRGGVLPLRGATFDDVATAVSAPRYRTVVAVEAQETDGLFRVTVTSRVSMPGDAVEVELTTMVWRP